MKLITDTSIDNTFIDCESGLQSIRNTSYTGRKQSCSVLSPTSNFKYSDNYAKRDSTFTVISELSQSWFNDQEGWYRQSQKLEKIVKWQAQCEKRYGFDPVSYFGGLVFDG